jgi:hypothetical protein
MTKQDTLTIDKLMEAVRLCESAIKTPRLFEIKRTTDDERKQTIRFLWILSLFWDDMGVGLDFNTSFIPRDMPLVVTVAEARAGIKSGEYRYIQKLILPIVLPESAPPEDVVMEPPKIDWTQPFTFKSFIKNYT